MSDTENVKLSYPESGAKSESVLIYSTGVLLQALTLVIGFASLHITASLPDETNRANRPRVRVRNYHSLSKVVDNLLIILSTQESSWTTLSHGISS